MNDMPNKEVYYTLPIPVLSKLSPLLTEYFGYRKEMFTNELLQAFNEYYPNKEDVIPNREHYIIDFPQFDEYAIDEGVFDYKRYAPRKPKTAKRFDTTGYMLDSNHDMTFTSNNEQLPQQILNLLTKYNEEDKQDVIGDALFIIAIIYEKHQSGKLYIDATWSEDILPYMSQVRPEMLKLYELLNIKRYSPKKEKDVRVLSPITIDNGYEKITIDNSCYWLTDLLDEYLHIYLGVSSLEEAQKELKEVYSSKKGRPADNAAYNLIVFGTFHLLQRYSSLTTKAKQLGLILEYLKLLGFFNVKGSKEDVKKNSTNYINSTISYLKDKGYKPKWRPKQMEDYNLSPNNPTIDHFW